jgi:hypothetical protein
MGVLLAVFVVGWIIFGIGYLLGALFFKDFFGAKRTWIGGLIEGFGALIAVLRLVIAGCSQIIEQSAFPGRRDAAGFPRLGCAPWDTRCLHGR